MQDMKSHFSIRNLVLSLVVVAGLIVIVFIYAEPVLRISTIPNEPSVDLNRNMQMLAGYLEQKIGMRVEYRSKRNGDALIKSLLFKELDLVWIDAARLERIQSHGNDGVMPIILRRGDTYITPISARMPSDGTYSWTVRAGLDVELRQKLIDAFLTMDVDHDKK